MNAIAKLERSLELKSLDALVAASSQDDSFLLMDCSGSMNEGLRNGKTRLQGLREVVADIRKEFEPQMIAFSGQWAEGSCFVVGDVPQTAGGGTPLSEAIVFAKENGAKRLVVVSDGIPNDPQGTLETARRFGGRIDVVFVGNPGESGSAFLDQLASLTGGSRFEGDLSDTRKLSARIAGLLSA